MNDRITWTKEDAQKAAMAGWEIQDGNNGLDVKALDDSHELNDSSVRYSVVDRARRGATLESKALAVLALDDVGELISIITDYTTTEW